LLSAHIANAEAIAGRGECRGRAAADWSIHIEALQAVVGGENVAW
jgi:hypothetical protein